MAAPLRIGIAGAMGRMGQAVAAAVENREGLEIAALFDRPELSVSGYVSRDEALASCDVIIDFTRPEATVALAQAAAAHKTSHGGVALILGSTGLSAEDEAAVAEAAKSIVIVRTGNFSLGVNVMVGLVRQAAARLGPEAWDIEIFEAHHRRKVDAPSGTALLLGRAAAEGRGVDLAAVSERARDGITGARAEGAIGFSVLRGGGIVGEHSVTFAAEDEILTISHSARDRSLFARGAVEAALWTRGRAPGLYDMQDVLGFGGG